MLTTGNQLRAARGLADMDQGTLAQAAGVNINTISAMERAGPAILTTALDKVKAVMAVLELAGIEFLNHGQPGVRICDEPAWGFLNDDKQLVGIIKNGELRRNRDGKLIALVKGDQLRDLETGEFLCHLLKSGWPPSPLPASLEERLK